MRFRIRTESAHASLTPYLQEVRVKDYLRFYQTTGGPPPPCPTEPYTAEQRAALSLPPRFSPWKDPTAAAAPLHQPMPNGSNPLLDDQMVGRSMSSSQQELPRIQVYAPVRVGTEIYENISCEPRLRGYSVEVCICKQLPYTWTLRVHRSFDGRRIARGSSTHLCLFQLHPLEKNIPLGRPVRQQLLSAMGTKL